MVQLPPALPQLGGGGGGGGVGVGDGDGLGEGDGDGEGDGEGEGLGDGLGDGFGPGEGDGEGVGDVPLPGLDPVEDEPEPEDPVVVVGWPELLALEEVELVGALPGDGAVNGFAATPDVVTGCSDELFAGITQSPMTNINTILDEKTNSESVITVFSFMTLRTPLSEFDFYVDPTWRIRHARHAS